jgi:hypothetical protein
MKEKFNEGVLVRFKFKDGSLGAYAIITEPDRSPEWLMRGYIGEGFYHVTTVHKQLNLIAHEDDLVFVGEEEIISL